LSGMRSCGCQRSGLSATDRTRVARSASDRLSRGGGGGPPPGPVLARLRRGRISGDLFVAPVLQQIALDVLTAPGWNRHLGGVRRVLRERRDALVTAVRDLLPGCELAPVPTGGVHRWLRLPGRFSDADVATAAASQRLAVSPGRACFPGEPPGPYLRLSYAAEEPPALVRGVEIIAEILRAS
jgi:DNA-binding transcriptional MocR family regulator